MSVMPTIGELKKDAEQSSASPATFDLGYVSGYISYQLQSTRITSLSSFRHTNLILKPLQFDDSPALPKSTTRELPVLHPL
jgi:hypothetical protein